MSSKVKIVLLSALVVVFVASASYAGLLGDVLKVGGIGYVVDKFGSQINDFVNKVTMNKDLGTTEATAVVPIISFGRGGYVGAVQVIGSKENVEKCKAVVQIEDNTVLGTKIRVKALVPVGSKTTSDIKRIYGVGVSAIVDIRI